MEGKAARVCLNDCCSVYLLVERITGSFRRRWLIVKVSYLQHTEKSIRISKMYKVILGNKIYSFPNYLTSKIIFSNIANLNLRVNSSKC